MANLIGQTLGRYKILEQLGEGGMATVYKGYDTVLERNVAIKVIRSDQFAPSMLAEILKRFEREAKALARLSHPNIVHVHDYGEFEGAPYLVMEYLPSGTLNHRPDLPMPWPQALHYILPIAHALEYAHELNIIHRDIKPGNILLTDRGIPMLSDFGIAKILESNASGGTLTGTGMSIGTPEYMAPEQWLGQSSPQSDIYSLGVVLYELVTGRKPYVADTPVGIMLKQNNEALPRPSGFVADLPPALDDAIVKALEKKPEDRFASMSEFAAALEALTGGQTILAAPKPATQLPGATVLASGTNRGTPPPASPGTTLEKKSPTPAPEPQTRPPKKKLAWIPLTIALVLLCVAVISGGALVLRGLNGLSRGRTTPTTLAGLPATQPNSQTQGSNLPAEQVKILWDTSHGPRTDANGQAYTPEVLYSSLKQLLGNKKFSITSGDLSNLNSFNILVISEASGQTAYAKDEVDAIEQFVRTSGHGLLILSDSPGLENLASTLADRFGITLGEGTSAGPVTYSNAPFLTGVTTIKFGSGGGIFHVNSPSLAAAQDKNNTPVIAYCECEAGRVAAIADTNLWDNQTLSQGDNQAFAVNVFNWLAKVGGQ